MRQMRSRPYWLVILVTMSGTAEAIPSQVEIDSLRDVTPITVSVSPVPQWMKDEGIDRENTRENIEKKLHEAGVSISSGAPNGGNLVLFFGGNVLKNTGGGPREGYLFSCGISLMQHVRLSADNRSSVASTWEYQKLGFFTSRSVAAGTAVAVIDQILKRFITDYKSVNAKPASRQ